MPYGPGSHSRAVPDELKQAGSCLVLCDNAFTPALYGILNRSLLCSLQARRTPCARLSSEDIFVSVCEVVWSYIANQWDTREHIRTACRHGRQLHDRMSTSLVLDLSKTTKVPHADIRTTLSGMVQRGARFQTAVVMFNTEGSHSRQRKQL